MRPSQRIESAAPISSASRPIPATSAVTSVFSGFTTSFPTESSIKSAAIARCQKAYILADSSKFDSLAAITFAEIYDASIITDHLPDNRYLNHTEILEVEDRA